MRPAVILGVVAILVLSTASIGGLAQPGNGAGDTATDDCERVADAPQQPNPDADRLGWENGCWYSDSIAIDQTDGLSEAELQAVVSRAMARVEHIRQMEFTRDVPVNITSREEFANRVGNRSTNRSFHIFDNTKFEALFLINESAGSIGVQERNSAVATLGFYSPQRGKIVLIAEDREAATLGSSTLAHELVHALQDQQFNLSQPRFHGSTRDEVNAIDGVVEGDANYVQYQYIQRRCRNTGHAWNGTCVTPPSTNGSGGGSLGNIGVYFVKFVPYSDGPTLVQYVRLNGGWSSVNAMYTDLPESSEQVIHPESYNADAPTNVTLEDRTDETWSRVRPPDRPDYAVLGQGSIASMLVFPLYDSQGMTQIVNPRVWLNLTASGQVSRFDPLNYGFAAAAGWDGDRLHVYRNEQNETAYVWRIVWDSEADADEFLTAYRQVIRYWGGEQIQPDVYDIPTGGFADAIRISRNGSTVTIVNAPTVEGLSTVRHTGTTTTPTSTTVRQTEPKTTSAVSRHTPTASPITEATATTPDDPPQIPGFGVTVTLLGMGVAAWLLSRRR